MKKLIAFFVAIVFQACFGQVAIFAQNEVVIAVIGQSNAVNMFSSPTLENPNPNTQKFSLSGGYEVNTGGGAIVLANELNNFQNDSIILIDSAFWATALHSENDIYNVGFWLDTVSGSLFYEFLTAVNTLGKTVDYVLWVQGETDAMAGVSLQDYYSGLETLWNRIKINPLIQGAKFILYVTGRNTFYLDDQGTNSVRFAQYKFADGHQEVFIGGESTTFNLYDIVHYSSLSQELMGKRFAETIFHISGLSTYHRGPYINSWTLIDSSTIDLNIIHRGGTDFTPEVISGFKVNNDTVSAIRLNPTTIRLNGSNFTDNSIISYLSGADPDISNFAKDNSSLTLPLEAYTNDIDGDEVENDFDFCPFDANKVFPGICGCDIADIDTDGDGTNDCSDLCPDDPERVIPGICGCGNPYGESDSDVDGIIDCLDNCPGETNFEQDDLDDDGIGDICDSQTCGNGILEILEECEINNPVADGWCSPQCTICVDNDGDLNAINEGICGIIDCNDNDSSINRFATEIIGNGIDDDCSFVTNDDGSLGSYLYFPAIKDGPQVDGIWQNYFSISANDPSQPINVSISLYNSNGTHKFTTHDVTPVNGRLVKTPNWIMHGALDVEAFNGTVIIETEAPAKGMTNSIAPNLEAFSIYLSPTPSQNLFIPAGYDNSTDQYRNTIHIQNIGMTPVDISVSYVDDYSGTIIDTYQIPGNGEYERIVREIFGGNFNGTIRISASSEVVGMLRFEKMNGPTVEAMSIFESATEKRSLIFPYLYDGFGGNSNYISIFNPSLLSNITCNYCFYPNGYPPVFCDTIDLTPGTRITTTPSWAMWNDLNHDYFGSMLGTCDGDAVSTTNVIISENEGLNFHESVQPKQVMIFPQVYEEEEYVNEIHLQNPENFQITVTLELFYNTGILLGTHTTSIEPYGKFIIQPHTINTSSYPTNGSLKVTVSDGNQVAGVLYYRKQNFVNVHEGVAP